MNRVRKILVIAVDHGLGNLVLITSMLRSLKEGFPQIKVSIVVSNPIASEVFDHNPNLDHIIIFRPQSSHRFMEGIIFFYKKLRPNRYDLCISCYIADPFNSSIWSYFSGAPYRLGYYLKYQGRIYGTFVNHFVVEMDNHKHEVEQYHDILKVLGAKGDPYPPELFITQEEIQFAKVYLEKMGVTADDIILGVHPGSNSRLKQKRWPLSNFVKVANLFSGNGISTIFFIGPDEIELLEELHKREGFRQLIVSGLSLRQVAALIKRCILFLSNDSSLMHIAAALQVPVVALFGPTLHRRNKPYGREHIVIRKQLPCSPCYNFQSGMECQEPHCLYLISPEEVVSVVKSKIYPS